MTSDIIADANMLQAALKAVVGVASVAFFDGPLDGGTINTIFDFVGTNLSIHVLQCEPPKKCITVVESGHDWAYKVQQALTDNAPMLILCDSKTALEELHGVLKPTTGRTLLFITGDSPDAEKDMLVNAGDLIQQGVVVGASPVMVSLHDIRGKLVVFFLITGKSVSHSDLLQMAGRARDAEDLYVFVANVSVEGDVGNIAPAKVSEVVQEVFSAAVSRNCHNPVRDLMTAKLVSASEQQQATLLDLMTNPAMMEQLLNNDLFSICFLAAARVPRTSAEQGPFCPPRNLDEDTKLRLLLLMLVGHTQTQHLFARCLCGVTRVSDGSPWTCDLCVVSTCGVPIRVADSNPLAPNTVPAALWPLQRDALGGQLGHCSFLPQRPNSQVFGWTLHDRLVLQQTAAKNRSVAWVAASFLWSMLHKAGATIRQLRRSQGTLSFALGPISADFASLMTKIDNSQLKSDVMNKIANTVGDKLDQFDSVGDVLLALLGASHADKLQMRQLHELFAFLVALGLPPKQQTIDTLSELQQAAPIEKRFKGCGILKGTSVLAALDNATKNLDIYMKMCIHQLCGRHLVSHAVGDADVVLQEMLARRIEAILAVITDIARVDKSTQTCFLLSVDGIVIPPSISFNDNALEKSSDAETAKVVLAEVTAGSSVLYGHKAPSVGVMTVRDLLRILKKMIKALYGMKITAIARTGRIHINRFHLAVRLQAFYLRLMAGMQVHARRDDLLSLIKTEIAKLPDAQLVLFTAAGITIRTVPTLPRTDTVASSVASLPATQPYNPSQDVFDDDFDEKARAFLPRKLAGLTQNGIVVSLEHMQELWLRLSPFERGVILGTESVDNHQAIQLKFKAGTLLSEIIDEFGRRSSVLQATIEKMRAMQRTSTLDSMSSICGSLDPGLWRTIEDSSGDEDDLANSDTSDEEPQMRCPFIDGEAGESDCEDSVQSVAGTEGPSEYGSDRETQSFPKRQRTSGE